jgi:hypothetical protein
VARRGGAFEGPILLLWAALALAGLAGAVLAVRGAGEEGVRALLRATAACSLALFLAAFAASALHRRLRAPATAWLLRNRRQAGLAMALSHALHGAAIVALAVRWPAAGAGIPAATRVVGSLGYVVLAALVLTSNDRAVAWLGGRRWRGLHRAGGWALWTVFALSYGPGAAAAPIHALASAALAAVAGLRLWTWLDSRASGIPSPIN